MVYDYRNGDFDGLRGALEALSLCNLIQDRDDISLDWTYGRGPFCERKNIKEKKNTPPWIKNHPRSAEIRRLLAQS